MKVFKSAVFVSAKRVEKAADRTGMYTLHNVRSGSYDYFRSDRLAKKRAAAARRRRAGAAADSEA